jgi:phage shock protein A
MGIFTRMLRLWKADMHGVMDQLEDKGLLLKQYLREMEGSLQQKEARCEALTQGCRKIQRDITLRGEEIEKFNKDIDLAVVKSKDDMARMLIRKRQSLQASCAHLQQQLELVTEQQRSLSEVLEHQRMQYDQLKLKSEAFFRQEQTRQYEDHLAGFNGLTGFQTPTEDEVELELLQRKEAIVRGGEA